jgi:RNA polymerase sigma-70 factor (ECF subfamily)
VFHRFGPDLLRRATRLVGRRDEAEDLVQEVFVAYTRYQRRIVDLEHARAWLHLVLVQRTRAHLRKRTFWRVLGVVDAAADLPTPDATPEERLSLARLYAALDQLGSGPRLAWTLRHLEGEPLAEVARACSCSLATAKRWIARAEDQLRGVVE